MLSKLHETWCDTEINNSENNSKDEVVEIINEEIADASNGIIHAFILILLHFCDFHCRESIQVIKKKKKKNAK